MKYFKVNNLSFQLMFNCVYTLKKKQDMSSSLAFTHKDVPTLAPLQTATLSFYRHVSYFLCLCTLAVLLAFPAHIDIYIKVAASLYKNIKHRGCFNLSRNSWMQAPKYSLNAYYLQTHTQKPLTLPVSRCLMGD